MSQLELYTASVHIIHLKFFGRPVIRISLSQWANLSAAPDKPFLKVVSTTRSEPQETIIRLKGRAEMPAFLCPRYIFHNAMRSHCFKTESSTTAFETLCYFVCSRQPMTRNLNIFRSNNRVIIPEKKGPPTGEPFQKLIGTVTLTSCRPCRPCRPCLAFRHHHQHLWVLVCPQSLLR